MESRCVGLRLLMLVSWTWVEVPSNIFPTLVALTPTVALTPGTVPTCGATVGAKLALQVRILALLVLEAPLEAANLVRIRGARNGLGRDHGERRR